MLSVETYPSAAEAARAMGPDARFLAGGTLVMRDANFALPGLRRIVRTTDLALQGIRVESGLLVIGAATSMAEIIAHPDTTVLAPVARAIGGPALRNMASVGGNLFAAHPYGDFATALLALDARARMADGAEIALSDLLARRDTLGGLVTAVSLARPDAGTFRFRKVARVKPKGVSMMSMAAVLPRPAGRIAGARVAYGAMAPTPIRMPAVEQALEGATLDAAGIARALAVATQGRPRRDTRRRRAHPGAG
ncbi:MAG: FAD binding domain-containing protein [Pseudomonadota bacterium]